MHEVEVDYLATANFDKYVGKWVALLDKKVIAVGNTFKEVAEKVDLEYPGKRPLLSKVPEKMAHIL
jgi:hypothetical protein